MRPAAVFDKGGGEHAERRDEQPRLALEHLDDAPGDEEGEHYKNENGRKKFHWNKFYSFCVTMQVLRFLGNVLILERGSVSRSTFPLQIKPLRVTDPRSGFKLSQCCFLRAVAPFRLQ